MSKHRVTDNGDWYFSIAGSQSDGWQVHRYKKLGWDSVTYAEKTFVFSHPELLEFLAASVNHIEPPR